MSIDLSLLTDRQKTVNGSARPQKAGKRGMTAVEALRVETTTLERKIHTQFSISVCDMALIIGIRIRPKNQASEQGLPDFLCLKDSRGIGIEFKIPPNKFSVAQEHRFMLLAEHGNLVYVCKETGPGEAYKEATRLLRTYYDLSEKTD